jgi:hypothetical protein
MITKKPIRLLSIIFLLSLLFIACKKDEISPFQAELNGFNALSGFNAQLVSDDDLVARAKAWQGQGDYPGVDNWFAVEINYGLVVLGGIPGQSEYYTIASTYKTSNGDKTTFWQMLQVKAHPQFGYRTQVACYVTNNSFHAAISRTLANTQFGDGGAWQLYIENYSTNLSKFSEFTLSN